MGRRYDPNVVMARPELVIGRLDQIKDWSCGDDWLLRDVGH